MLSKILCRFQSKINSHSFPENQEFLKGKQQYVEILIENLVKINMQLYCIASNKI